MTGLKKLCYEAVLLSFGLLLPQIFHFAGGPAAGGIFLPMHIPVLLAGLLFGSWYGAFTGVALPVLSALVTGMPPIAKLPFMAAELLAYGLIAGLLNRKNIFFALPAAMVAGRLASAAALFVAGVLLRLDVPAVYTVGTAFLTGIPGIVIQLLLIPPLVPLLRRVMHGQGNGTRKSAA